MEKIHKPLVDLPEKERTEAVWREIRESEIKIFAEEVKALNDNARKLASKVLYESQLTHHRPTQFFRRESELVDLEAKREASAVDRIFRKKDQYIQKKQLHGLVAEMALLYDEQEEIASYNKDLVLSRKILAAYQRHVSEFTLRTFALLANLSDGYLMYILGSDPSFLTKYRAEYQACSKEFEDLKQIADGMSQAITRQSEAGLPLSFAARKSLLAQIEAGDTQAPLKK